jgi:glucose-6-phosphate isomerase
MESITSSNAWKTLQKHYDTEAKHFRLTELVDSARFDKYSLKFGSILLDFSKNLVSDKTMMLLFDLCRHSHLEEWRSRMFSADLINTYQFFLIQDRAARSSSCNI